MFFNNVFKKIFSINKTAAKVIIYFLFIKLSFKNRDKIFISNGDGNFVDAGKNINLKTAIEGNNNIIHIDNASNYGHSFNININISGSNNEIIIKKPYNISSLNIIIGNHGQINNCRIYIDELTSMVDVTIYCFQHSSNVTIGKNCTLSKNICFRTGEYPHLIFDKQTGEYLDKGSDIIVGNHCWIGENVTFLKNASIPEDCIVGCCSVVTKKFEETNAVIAGNPAQVRKQNVYFVRNELFLDKSTLYYKNFRIFQSKYDGKYCGNETINSKHQEVKI